MTKSWKEITTRRPDTAERRAAYEEGGREAVGQIVAYNLAELRKLRSVTQVELARQVGVAQPSLSGLERRSDVQLSTLRDYIEGLGGQLEISAVFDDIKVPVARVFEDPERPKKIEGVIEAVPGSTTAREPRGLLLQDEPSSDHLPSVESNRGEVMDMVKQRRTVRLWRARLRRFCVMAGPPRLQSA
ncbi:MAG: XRE family transcriptional regulator [Acidimicrobiales bacterium]